MLKFVLYDFPIRTCKYVLLFSQLSAAYKKCLLHLAHAFIRSTLKRIQGICFISSCISLKSQ